MSRLKVDESHIDLLRSRGRDVMYCLHMSFQNLMNTINGDDSDDCYVLIGGLSRPNSPFCISEIGEDEWSSSSCKINWVVAIPISELPRSVFV